LDAAEQKSGLTAFDKKTIGELDVESGELYYGFGDYKNAVTAINRGLDKGGIKHLDEAYVYLGLSRAGVRTLGG
jgi:hypothetical protein